MALAVTPINMEMTKRSEARMTHMDMALGTMGQE